MVGIRIPVDRAGLAQHAIAGFRAPDREVAEFPRLEFAPADRAGAGARLLHANDGGGAIGEFYDSAAHGFGVPSIEAVHARTASSIRSWVALVVASELCI